jgi:hypothetical protein
LTNFLDAWGESVDWLSKRFFTVSVTGWAVLALVGFARADESAQPFTPPKYERLRFNENYECLRDPALRRDFWDPIKYIPLNTAGDTYVSFGGETRQMFEYIKNYNWGQGRQDPGGYYFMRYKLHADLHLGDGKRLFAEFKSGSVFGRDGGPRRGDEDRLDLHQAFLDLPLYREANESLALRMGRQELLFGTKLMDVRDRMNVRRNFDAFRADLDVGAWKVSSFLSRPVEVNSGILDDGGEDRQALWGVYSSRPTFLAIPSQVDFYYLGLNREQATFNQGVGDETRHTLGTRLWGNFKALDYDTELIYQFGGFGGADISAYALTNTTGYSFNAGKFPTRFSLRAGLYSGDNNPRDNVLQTFNPIYPATAFIGQLGATGLGNERTLQPRFEVGLTRGISLKVSHQAIWRDSLNDGIFLVSPRGLIRPGNLSRERYVGNQEELELSWEVDRHLTLRPIFNYFFAGPFLHETPPGKDIVYCGFIATYIF